MGTTDRNPPTNEERIASKLRISTKYNTLEYALARIFQLQEIVNEHNHRGPDEDPGDSSPDFVAPEGREMWLQCDCCKVWSPMFTFPGPPEYWDFEFTPSGYGVAMCPICRDIPEEYFDHIAQAIQRVMFPRLDEPQRPNHQVEAPKPEACGISDCINGDIHVDGKPVRPCNICNPPNSPR